MPQLYVSTDVWEGAAPMRWALYGMLPRDDMDAPGKFSAGHSAA